jgi:hypothetical protein
MDKALSSLELYKLFENKIKIIPYKRLVDFDTIEEVFDPYRVVFILYETKPFFGHWTVICTDSTTNYFFDPYGFKPDEELKFTSKEYRKANNMWLPYLSYLLIKSPKKLVYNKYKLQDITDKSVATCGRWCALYAYFYDQTSIKEFAETFLNSNITPDQAITIITSFI